MAVYKIFPSKDATIYSNYPSENTGMDAILELSSGYTILSPNSSARILIQFPQDQIQSVIQNKVSASFSASLQMYLADAVNLADNYSVEVFPVYQQWDMGTGKYGQSPVETNGVSWTNAKPSSSWQTTGLPVGVVTASATGFAQGGGNWYTASSATASFGVYDVKDVDLDVTTTVQSWYTGSIDNNGFIVKVSGSGEFESTEEFKVQYFSRDTSTIYPPSLNIKWDDSVFNPVSQSFICSNANINISLQNAPTSYDPESVHKVRVSVRDKFPVRQFTTGSLATQLKYLPSSSYWSVIDLKTKDVVVDFDDNATKISADSLGNYFNFHMNGIEPYRYYQVVIKSIIGSETVVFKDDLIFKVE